MLLELPFRASLLLLWCSSPLLSVLVNKVLPVSGKIHTYPGVYKINGNSEEEREQV